MKAVNAAAIRAAHAHQRVVAALLCSCLLAAVPTGCVQAMTVLDFFLGTSMPLTARGTIDANGLRLRREFEVEKRCTYHFDLRLLHKTGSIREFQSVIAGNALTMPIWMELYRLDGGERLLASDEKQPTLAIRGEKWTGFNLGQHRLEDGEYRVVLRTEQALVRLQGVEFEFVVQVMPKTYCTGM